MARRGYDLYDDDDEPDCFGIRWEDNDEVCLECDHETACRRKLLTQKRKKRKQKIAKRRSIEDEATDEAESYDELIERMPRDGEHWVERVAKNSASGMLSAFGREIMLFFKKWRW